jgi:uncharacterized protein YdeI (YjbR/CyaY-like superfamily)
MEITKTFYAKNRTEWRRWLAKNHKKAKEVWLIYYKKESGKARISYDDAVLEALCYGWIDSTLKGIDKESFAQRFSPRKNTSVLSQMNKERIRELIKEKKMTPAGLAALAHVFDPAKHLKEKFVIPPGILKALKANKEAWKHFQKMPASYQRIRVQYIEGRKLHNMSAYRQSLKNFVKMTAQNKRIGFVKERTY